MVVLKLLIKWPEEVDMKCDKSHTFYSSLKLPFALYLLNKKRTKIEFSDVDTPSFIYIIDIKFKETERKWIFPSVIPLILVI